MKLKFKLGRPQIIALVIAGLAVVALLASRGGDGGNEGPGRLDNAAVRACDDFAAGQSAARSNSARLSLADKVTASAAESDNDPVRTRSMELGRQADEGNAAWRTAANALTRACQEAGWTAP
ncbi:hypothetical protein Aab01nite_48510 [Paractinoplanes abujensis]|uniref:Uncharacterized protein n=1 Tax=Paractinoplanes abujensis TaxID=882441 RepID=A0A7W7CL11_9ACTN|nr:hypothetical protein [Actinoplanes abujensis]MBB4690496.1 hypothetical protein [Actinoplanes abujensis]GID21261.1 hypothetical protein Aab01nite_48510 [Actinoplanes abujensis]